MGRLSILKDERLIREWNYTCSTNWNSTSGTSAFCPRSSNSRSTFDCLASSSSRSVDGCSCKSTVHCSVLRRLCVSSGGSLVLHVDSLLSPVCKTKNSASSVTLISLLILSALAKGSFVCIKRSAYWGGSGSSFRVELSL